MSLTALTLSKKHLETERESLRDLYERESKRIARELVKITEQLNFVSAGLDEDLLKLGMSVVSFGDLKGNSERRGCVTDAINDLAAGGKTLSEKYFGTKDYAHWSDQREDHEYGYGPRHGSIVFKVGLTNDALAKFLRGGLTEGDIESAIYCLMNIDEINRQKKAASQAA
ncbi:hypothetical protein ACMV8I_18810 [Ewingella sp. S1.OA.A_B6]